MRNLLFIDELNLNKIKMNMAASKELFCCCIAASGGISHGHTVTNAVIVSISENPTSTHIACRVKRGNNLIPGRALSNVCLVPENGIEHRHDNYYILVNTLIFMNEK